MSSMNTSFFTTGDGLSFSGQLDFSKTAGNAGCNAEKKKEGFTHDQPCCENDKW